jgi:hypothetical protein
MRYGDGNSSGVMKGKASVEGLAAYIAKGQLYDCAVVCGQGDRSDTGYLADLLAVSFQGCSSYW